MGGMWHCRITTGTRGLGDEAARLEKNFASECAAQFDFYSLEGTLDVSSARQDLEQEIGGDDRDKRRSGDRRSRGRMLGKPAKME